MIFLNTLNSVPGFRRAGEADCLKVTAVIPTLNPNERIFAVVRALCENGFSSILVVDDGSDARCRPIFEVLAENPRCTVLAHPQNLGKGRALKTAFRHYLTQPGEWAGVVTLDDDGQHDIESVTAVARALQETGDALVLGVRDFDAGGLPLKSRLGNKITSVVLALACGVHVSDTQTGLRAIPNRLLPALAEVPGDRFEYETNMLLATKQHHIPIREVPIRTIYIENNKGTHFRPLVDSLRIYRTLLRFLLSSGFSFLVDVALFWLISSLPLGATVTRVFWATLVSRGASSVVNFLINRRLVFRQEDRLLHSAARYYLLCVGQAAASFLLVSILGVLSAGRWLVGLKMLVDGALFFCSFQIQKRWVFRPAADGVGVR